MVVVFELRPLDDLEPHAGEYRLDPVADDRQGVPAAERQRPAGQRHVHRANGSARRFDRELAFGEPLLDVDLQGVRALPERRPLGGRRRRHAFEERRHQAALARQVAIADAAQIGIARDRRQVAVELRAEIVDGEVSGHRCGLSACFWARGAPPPLARARGSGPPARTSLQAARAGRRR